MAIVTTADLSSPLSKRKALGGRHQQAPVLEYVDHRREVKGSRPSYVLLGDVMDLKVRAFKVIQEQAAKAA